MFLKSRLLAFQEGGARRARGQQVNPAVMRWTWIAVFAGVLVWSGYQPADTVIWILEVFPALIGAVVLWFTRNRFPLTRLTYVLILLHCIILMVGGHYTYAEVPLGDWVRDAFDQSRNNYDKLGHLLQGFVPAIVAREIVVRQNVFNFAGWRNFFIVCFCLAVAAFYELIEWWVAIASGESAEAFLSLQGYVWDTQADMWTALIGAVVALTLLGGLHDRQLRRSGFVTD
jgi:putative membrane protein